MDQSQDHMMHLTYVSFSYLSKVNLGGRLCIGRGHLVKTPVTCSRNEPMHHYHLFPLLVSCSYL